MHISERRNVMKKAGILLFIFVLVFLFTFLAGVVGKSANAQEFKTKLKGSQEVPPVKTKASGEAIFREFEGKRRMIYRLYVSDIENVTAAHIHNGKKGENGPPVLILYRGPKKAGKFSGMIAEGIVTNYELLGPLEGKTLRALKEMIYAGDAYVNVHTVQHPDGEIRGQLR
jgi:hypothetical protein